jgi:hypothetical protein
MVTPVANQALASDFRPRSGSGPSFASRFGGSDGSDDDKRYQPIVISDPIISGSDDNPSFSLRGEDERSYRHVGSAGAWQAWWRSDVKKVFLLNQEKPSSPAVVLNKSLDDFDSDKKIKLKEVSGGFKLIASTRSEKELLYFEKTGRFRSRERRSFSRRAKSAVRAQSRRESPDLSNGQLALGSPASGVGSGPSASEGWMASSFDPTSPLAAFSVFGSELAF